MSHSVSDCYDFYDETIRRARREHQCSACAEPIPVGAYYCDLRLMWEGAIKRYKRCGRCQALHTHLRDKGSFHDMWPNERLDCGQDYVDEWGPLPEEIAELAFVEHEEIGRLLDPARGRP